jgi:hypothetical protein
MRKINVVNEMSTIVRRSLNFDLHQVRENRILQAPTIHDRSIKFYILSQNLAVYGRSHDDSLCRRGWHIETGVRREFTDAR